MTAATSKLPKSSTGWSEPLTWFIHTHLALFEATYLRYCKRINMRLYMVEDKANGGWYKPLTARAAAAIGSIKTLPPSGQPGPEPWVP